MRRRAPTLWFTRFGLGWRHREEGPGLIGDVLEVDQAAAFADDVEEIAMLTGGRICLMFNCT